MSPEVKVSVDVSLLRGLYLLAMSWKNGIIIMKQVSGFGQSDLTKTDSTLPEMHISAFLEREVSSKT